MGPHTLVPPTSLPRSFPAHARSTSCSADASGPGCPHRPIATLPLPAETTRGTHHPPLALASAARRARIKRPPCPSPAPPPTHAPRASRDLATAPNLLLPPPAFDSAAASSGTAEVREILPVSSRDLIILPMQQRVLLVLSGPRLELWAMSDVVPCCVPGRVWDLRDPGIEGRDPSVSWNGWVWQLRVQIWRGGTPRSRGCSWI
jgi:hypothetical protein